MTSRWSEELAPSEAQVGSGPCCRRLRVAYWSDERRFDRRIHHPEARYDGRVVAAPVAAARLCACLLRRLEREASLASGAGRSPSSTSTINELSSAGSDLVRERSPDGSDPPRGVRALSRVSAAASDMPAAGTTVARPRQLRPGGWVRERRTHDDCQQPLHVPRLELRGLRPPAGPHRRNTSARVGRERMVLPVIRGNGPAPVPRPR
jgi:hypothetical protein